MARLCADALPALFEKHRLGPVGAVELDETGWVNLCFLVEREYVVRINARDPHLPKFRREQIAYEMLAVRGFPVPEVVALDVDRDPVAFDVLITQRLPGTNLEHDWEAQTPPVRQGLIEQAAYWLKRMHEVTFSGFGELASGTPTASWGAAVCEMMRFHLDEARALGTFADEDICRIDELFDRKVASLLDEIEVPSLVHADFHPGNLLHVGGEITGLLDFEWAFAGDPLFDLAYQQNLDGMGFPDSFIDAVGPALGERDQRRRQLYRCMRNVELSNVAKQHFDVVEARDYRDVTLRHLKRQSVWRTEPG